MNTQTLKQYYVWSIKALIFVIPFLSLWISTSMFFPYITGRNFAFRILVELAFVLWAALAVLKKEYRPKMSPMTIALLVFVGVIGLANLLGVDPSGSFWSRLERMEGYMMILHLAAYFLVITNVFRTKQEWLQLFNAVVVAGIAVGFYGVLQLLGLKEAIQGGGFRIDGTIGNPTYLAAYLTLVITMALILLANTGTKVLKYFYGASVAFFFLIMFFTATRGAALSLAVAIPLFLILYLIFIKPSGVGEFKVRKIIAGLLVAMVVLPVALLAIRNTSLIQNNAVLSRLTSISLGERTIKSRFLIWNIGLQAFKEHPILGWGQENFIYAFSKYFDPKLYDQEPWFDRPHNIIFEWLLNGGILGLLAYLSLFGVLFYYIFKLAKRGVLGIREAILTAVAIVAYFFQNLFVFDNFNTYVLFFGVMAYLNRLYVESSGDNSAVADTGDRVIPSRVALTAGLLLAAGAIYFLNLKPMAQGQGIILALKATASQNDPLQQSLDAFKDALAKNTFANGETLEQLARVTGLLIGQNGFPAETKKSFVQYSVEEMEKYLERHPAGIRLHLMLANLYQAGRSLDSSYFIKSREHLQIAQQLSPRKQQILFLRADNYLLTGETDKALEVLEKAVELEPSYREAQLNLATIGIFLGRNDIVSKVVDDLNKIRLNSVDKKLPHAPLWNFINDLKKIFEVYMRVGQPKNARLVYDFLLKLEPDVEKYGIETAYQSVVKELKDQLTN